MGIAAGRRGPLNVPEIGAAGHSYVSVTPRLCGNPVQGVAAVLDFIVIRHPFASAVLSAPDILYDDRVAALYEPVVLLCTVALTVGGADQDCRYLGGERPGTYCGGVQHMLGDDRAGKIDVCSQQLTVCRRDHVGSGKTHRADRFVAPFFQNGMFFHSGQYQDSRIIPPGHLYSVKLSV